MANKNNMDDNFSHKNNTENKLNSNNIEDNNSNTKYIDDGSSSLNNNQYNLNNNLVTKNNGDNMDNNSNTKKSKKIKAAIAIIMVLCVIAVGAMLCLEYLSPGVVQISATQKLMVDYGQDVDCSNIKIYTTSRIFHRQEVVPCTSSMVKYDKESFEVQSATVEYAGRTMKFELQVLPLRLPQTILSFDGQILSWNDSAKSYVININGIEETVTECRYDLSTSQKEGEISVKVKAVSDDRHYISRGYSDTLKIRRLSKPEFINCNGETISWGEVVDATRYLLVVDQFPTEVTGTQYDYPFLKEGVNHVSVKALGTSNVLASKPITKDFTKLAPVSNIVCTANGISWASENTLCTYEVWVNDTVINSNKTSVEFDFAVGTEYSIKIKPVSNAAEIINGEFSSTIKVNKLQMATNMQFADGLLKWAPVDLADGYIVIINGTQYQTTKTSFDLTSIELPNGNIKASVIATAVSQNLISSEPTALFNITKLANIESIALSDGKITWSAVTGATKYLVTINGVATTVENALEFEFSDIKEGINTISVQAFGSSDTMPSAVATKTIEKLKVITEINYSKGSITWAQSQTTCNYQLVINGTPYDLTKNSMTFDLDPEVDYLINVKAVAKNKDCIDSEFSDNFTICKLGKPTNLKCEGGLITWSAVANADEYLVTLGGFEQKTSKCQLNANNLTLPVGNVTVSVKALSDQSNIFESDNSQTLTVQKLECTPKISYENGKIKWVGVSNAASYEIVIKDKTYTATGCEFAYAASSVGAHWIKVKAIGGSNAINGNYSDVTFNKLAAPFAIDYGYSGLTWQSYNSNCKFEVVINGEAYVVPYNSFAYTFNVSVHYFVKVRAIATAENDIDSDFSGEKDFYYTREILESPKVQIKLGNYSNEYILIVTGVPNANQYLVTITFYSGEESYQRTQLLTDNLTWTFSAYPGIDRFEISVVANDSLGIYADSQATTITKTVG